MDELSKLTEEDRLQAMERFRLLQPHLEQGRILSEVAKEAGVPYRTAWRWMNLYRQFGLAALARKGRADVGGRRVLNSELRELVEGLALRKPPMSAASIHSEVFRIAQACGEKPPSYSVIYVIWCSVPKHRHSAPNTCRRISDRAIVFHQLFPLVAQ